MVPKEGSLSTFEFQRLKHYDASMEAVYFVRVSYLHKSALEVSGFVKQHCLTLLIVIYRFQGKYFHSSRKQVNIFP